MNHGSHKNWEQLQRTRNSKEKNLFLSFFAIPFHCTSHVERAEDREGNIKLEFSPVVLYEAAGTQWDENKMWGEKD